MHPDGIIAWGRVFAGLKEAGYQGTLLFEDGRGEDPQQWIRYTAGFPDAFAARYGS